MTKTILIMALVITLILSTFTLGNTASAIISENPALQFKIKFIGPGTCQIATGVECGAGLLKSMVRLQIQEATENPSTGIGSIRTIMSITDGWDFEDEFRSKSLLFAYDKIANTISISGDAKSSNGSTFQLDMNIVSIDLEQKKGDCSLTYTHTSGVTITQQEV